MEAVGKTVEGPVQGDEARVRSAMVRPRRNASALQLGIALVVAPFALVTAALIRPAQDS